MCHCVMSLLWWRWSEVVWISDGTSLLSFQQNSTRPCVLSVPFPCVHGENKSESLIVNCSESPRMHLLFFPASLAVEVGVVCFCFPQVLPFGWFEEFPCSIGGIAGPIQVSLCRPCRGPPCPVQVLGFFQPKSPSRGLQILNSQPPFLKVLVLCHFPLKMAEYLEIPGKCWLHPQGAALHHLCSQINTQTCCICCMLWMFTCRALELLCVQAWVVLHSRCFWCSVVASSLPLGWISQPPLSVPTFQSSFHWNEF